MSDHVPGPTLLQLLDELEKLDNWFMFGTRLGVPVNQLRKIESSHQLSIDRCKVDMLQYCLDNRVDISWVKIAETLEKTDQLALAAKIRQKYLSIDGGDNHTRELAHTSGSGSLNFEAQKESAYYVSAQYRRDFVHLQDSFSSMFERVCEVVKLSVLVDDLKQYLRQTFPEFETSFQDADQIADVMKKVRNECSLTDCCYFEAIARHFNLQKGAEEAIAVYNSKLQTFCDHTLASHSYVKSFHEDHSKNLHSLNKITFKLHWKAEEKTMNDIRDLLRMCFGELADRVQILVIQVGSVVIVCYAPQHLMGELVRISKTKLDKLASLGVVNLTISTTELINNQHSLSTPKKKEQEEPPAEDVVRKSDVSHSSDISEGATGVVHSGSQSKPTTKSKEVEPIINEIQAEHLLSGKPKGTFLVREMDGSARDPSLTSINTHDISVVTKGKKILHFGIYKKGKFYETRVSKEKFSSIKHMIECLSRDGFQTGEGIRVKLTDQLFPDKDTLASLPSDLSPIIDYYIFSDVASLPKHFPHHDENTWLCPQLSREESLQLLQYRVDETFLVRATELSEPNHIYTLDVVTKRTLMSMYIFKRGAWLQLESMDIRYDCIKTLVMILATSTIPVTVDGQVVNTNLRYPVHTARYYQH